jgi:hypothetical protein
MSTEKNTPDGNSILRALKGFRRPSAGQEPPPPPQNNSPAPSHSVGYVTPSRIHRKAITTWQDELAVQQLKELSFRTGVPQQKLIAIALNELFKQNGMKPVAS